MCEAIVAIRNAILEIIIETIYSCLFRRSNTPA
jgi:hypothetical protein